MFLIELSVKNFLFPLLPIFVRVMGIIHVIPHFNCELPFMFFAMNTWWKLVRVKYFCLEVIQVRLTFYLQYIGILCLLQVKSHKTCIQNFAIAYILLACIIFADFRWGAHRVIFFSNWILKDCWRLKKVFLSLSYQKNLCSLVAWHLYSTFWPV